MRAEGTLVDPHLLDLTGPEVSKCSDMSGTPLGCNILGRAVRVEMLPFRKRKELLWLPTLS